jgi:hypothetical protein
MAMRSEQEVFDDLAELCVRPGYSHAIAYFCFRDHVVGYGASLKGDDYAKLFSLDRLIRTEVSTLIGLMVRKPRDLGMPDSKTLEGYIKRTENLLGELHEVLNEPVKAEMKKAFADPKMAKDFNPFANAAALREPIFYGSESAYSFQYRDLSISKYANDEKWIREHKKFTPTEAKAVVIAIGGFLNEKLLNKLKEMRDIPPDKWSVLAGLEFSAADIAARAGLPEILARAVIDAFTYADNDNPTFTSLSEFNAINGYPILKADGDNRILFLYAGLTEALYETPFYWMNNDKSYVPVAMKNRGRFTEDFCTARLQRVFGVDKVYKNVDVWKGNSRKEKYGEIDTLVLFGDRAIIVQAKSKKLTLSARKGNDLQLQADFKAAIQDACDQAVECSRHLLSGGAVLSDSFGKDIAV